MPFIVLVLLIAAAMGGGVSVVAQNALPGEPLWSFKVNINERVVETLAVGDKAKADDDIAFAKTRLDEAAKLEAEGKLDAGARADLQGNFDAHARAVASRVAALQTRDDYAAAAEVATRFQATVAARVSGPLKLQSTLDAASALSADASAKAATH